MVQFCRPALETGLPLLKVRTNSYETATQLSQLSVRIEAKTERIAYGQQTLRGAKRLNCRTGENRKRRKRIGEKPS
jgi:hypothetical protein